jgi:hypothetical protein
VYLMLVPYGEFVSPAMTSILAVLIRVEFFNNLMFCRSSRRWFMLCLACIPHPDVGTTTQR